MLVFVKQEVSIPNGETVTMELAEMGSLVGSGKKCNMDNAVKYEKWVTKQADLLEQIEQ